MTWLHLAINILSGLLLGASNYCMQVLSAPTRDDVDAAHKKHKWRSIGVLIIKNLFYIGRKKAVLWVLLALTSAALHLVWSLAVVDTLSTNDYVINAATEDFVKGIPWNATSMVLMRYPQIAKNMSEKIRSNSLVNMSVPECIKAYGAEFVSKYGNIVLVHDIGGRSGPLFLQDSNKGTDTPKRSLESGGEQWMCGFPSDCDFGRLIQENVTHWNLWYDFSLAWYEGEVIAYWTGATTEDPIYIEGNVKGCLVEQTDRTCCLGIIPSNPYHCSPL